MNINYFKYLYSGWNVIILICVVPLLLAFNSSEISLFTIYGLGKIFGLLGTILFSLSFIFSTKHKILEKVFNEFNKIYKLNNKIAQLAFAMLFFHPIFLLPNYVSTSKEALIFFLPSTNWSLNFGIYSFAIILTLIILTQFFRFSHTIRNQISNLFKLAFFFGIMHVYLIPSDTSQYLPLRLYMLTIITFGFASFIYKLLPSNLLLKIKTRYSNINFIKHGKIPLN